MDKRIIEIAKAVIEQREICDNRLYCEGCPFHLPVTGKCICKNREILAKAEEHIETEPYKEYNQINDMSTFARLLGENNEKRLKDTLTDLLLNQVQKDLETADEYILYYDGLFSEIRKEVESRVKEMVVKNYTEKLAEKITRMLEENTHWEDDKE